MTSNEDIHVLFVDDEKYNLEAFRAAFRRYFSIHTANSASEAKEIMASTPISVIIADQRMPKTTGIQFLAEALKTHPHQTRMLITAYPDTATIDSAINDGQVYRYLTKPWNDELIMDAIYEAYHICKKHIKNR